MTNLAIHKGVKNSLVKGPILSPGPVYLYGSPAIIYIKTYICSYKLEKCYKGNK